MRRNILLPTVALGLAVGLGTGLGACAASGSSPTAASRAEHRTVAETALPVTYQFSQVSSEGGRLLVSGAAEGPGCRQATVAVDPGSLHVGAVKLSSCQDPDFAGQQAAPDLDYDPMSSTETFSVAVKTAHGGFVRRPVLATFEAPAGDHPIVTSADGFFWVWGTPVPGGNSQVTQVSATTGTVVQTVTLPRSDFGTPLVAADDDGLWLALPPNTGPNASPTSVYYVPSGGGPVRVIELQARAGWWLVANDHQMWLDTLPESGSAQRLWTATGPAGKLQRLDTVIFPEDATANDDAAAGGRQGLWTLDRTTGSGAVRCGPDETVHVVEVAPDPATVPGTGVEVPETACQTPLPQPDAFVYRGGSLYFLFGTNELYKVAV